MPTSVEREEVIYHGTTLGIAQQIGALDQFDERETYFAATRDLAEFFARRSSTKSKTAQSPAIIRVTIYADDLRNLKQNKLLINKGFDEGDNPQLRGKSQLVFNSEGIRFLNRVLLEMTVQPVEVRKV